MDELTPFRSTRNESRQPPEQVLAAGRDALMSRATASPGLPDTTPPGGETQTHERPSGFKKVTAPRWAAVAIAVTLTVLVVWAVVPALGLGGNDATHPASNASVSATPAETTPPVTREVYEAAYAEFAKCMKDHGVGLGAEQMEGQVHDYTYPASEDSVYRECYVAFQQIDAQWQIAHSYDSETFIKLRGCLEDIGIEPGKDADTVLAQVEESGLDVRKCIEQGTTNG